MSFYCNHCYFKNTEVQSAGEIQERGTKYVLKLDLEEDLERQIVKSDTGVLRIEDLDLEIPPGRGKLTNLEGILVDIQKDLEKDQKWRAVEAPEIHEKIDGIIKKVSQMSFGEAFPFSISINDPAGNSWIEPSPIDTSGKYRRIEYQRTPEENASLGLAGESSAEPSSAADVEGDESMEGVEILDGKLYTMPCQCPGCNKHAAMNMQMVNIPFFKQVIITAVVCKYCGYRTSDVKTGGEVPEKGQRIWLEVKGPKDLRRDILKSETCCLKIPQCAIDVQPGTMGGRFTTVEGLMTQMRDDLRSAIFDVDDEAGTGGDSMPETQKVTWTSFFTKLDQAINAEMPFTILLEDPLANSYVQSFTAPEPDPQIRSEEYERTEEEEEDLGLTDMRTHQDENGEYVKEEARKDQSGPQEDQHSPGVSEVSCDDDKSTIETITKDEVKWLDEDGNPNISQISLEESSVDSEEPVLISSADA